MDRLGRRRCRPRRAQLKRPMRACGVVVEGIPGKHPAQMPLPEDQLQGERAVDVEEVLREHAAGLGAQELPPAWCRCSARALVGCGGAAGSAESSQAPTRWQSGPVRPVHTWSWVGAAQDGDLVTQDEELDVLGGGRATRQHDQPKHLPEHQIEKPQRHVGIMSDQRSLLVSEPDRLLAPHVCPELEW